MTDTIMSIDNRSSQAKPSASDLTEDAAFKASTIEIDAAVSDALAQCPASVEFRDHVHDQVKSVTL